MQVSANGDFALRTQTSMIAGKYMLENGQFCTQSSAVMLGRKFCSPIYRNSTGTAEARSEYVYPDSTTIRYFSPAR